MDQKRVSLIVSDLHLGDGKAGDDFVDNKHQFANFVSAQADSEEGRAGDIELIINGDFLEFVQVLPQAYTLRSSEYWCSESESLTKLDCILAGHPDVFAALKEFQKPGNRVTIFAGNHDVDLYWDGVQKRIREKAGDVRIELREDTYYRYGGDSISATGTSSHRSTPPTYSIIGVTRFWPCLPTPRRSAWKCARERCSWSGLSIPWRLNIPLQIIFIPRRLWRAFFGGKIGGG
jgi:hypothetical protein